MVVKGSLGSFQVPTVETMHGTARDRKMHDNRLSMGGLLFSQVWAKCRGPRWDRSLNVSWRRRSRPDDPKTDDNRYEKSGPKMWIV